MAAKRIFPLLTLFLLVTSQAAAATLEAVDRLHEKAVTAGDFQQVAALIQEGSPGEASPDEWAWRLARAYYRQGKLAGEEAARPLYDRCIEGAQRAIAHNSGSAPGYFYKALCTGKKGQLEGLWKSLGVIEPFRRDMETALRLDPGFDHGGPNRALAKFYLELPFFLGGDLGKSLEHIRRAVADGPAYAENYLCLAEIHLAQGELEPAREALATLKDLAGEAPADPELEAILEKARQLEQKIEERKNPRDPYA